MDTPIERLPGTDVVALAGAPAEQRQASISTAAKVVERVLLTSIPSAIWPVTESGAKRALVAGLIFAVAGCSAMVSVRKPGAGAVESMSREEFRQYTERVFELHNQTATKVMMMADMADEAPVEGLYEAEGDMIDACQPLNRVVSRRMRGESAGNWLRLRNFPQQVTACHRATLAVQSLLDQT